MAGTPGTQSLSADFWITPYLVNFRPGSTCLKILHAAHNPEVRAQDMRYIFEINPVYRQFLFKLPMLRDRIQSWFAEEEQNPRKEEVVFERILALIGKSAARNFVLATRLNRISPTSLPKKKNDSKYTVNPSETLKWSLSVEEFFNDHNWAGAHEGFTAALHFDWFKSLLTLYKGSKESLLVLENAYKEGFERGKAAYAIAALLKNFKHQKVAFSAALLASLGKVMMALTHPSGTGSPSWTGFLTETERKQDRSTTLALYCESKRFSTPHWVYSALFVDAFGVYSEFERALACYPFPWDLKESHPDLHRLALVIYLSDRATKKLPPHDLQRKALSSLGIQASSMQDSFKRHAVVVS